MTKMNYNRGFLILKVAFVVFLFFSLTLPAYAVMNAGSLSNRDPLQPIPEDVFPNYKGNINFEVKKVQSPVNRQEQRDVRSGSREVNKEKFIHNVTEKKQTSNLPWAVAIVLFIVGAAGFIYVRVKKRKE